MFSTNCIPGAEISNCNANIAPRTIIIKDKIMAMLRAEFFGLSATIALPASGVSSSAVKRC
jgi:hypothetical protein